MSKEIKPIPEQEMADMENSPVSKEEMDAEMERLRQAMAIDNPDSADAKNVEALLADRRQRIQEIVDSKSPEQRQLEEAEIIEAMKEAMKPDWEKNEIQPGGEAEQVGQVPPDQGVDQKKANADGKGGRPIVMHEMHTQYKYKTCEACHGSGTKWFIFPCFTCGGSGNVLDSTHTTSSSKVLGGEKADKKKEGKEAGEETAQENFFDDKDIAQIAMWAEYTGQLIQPAGVDLGELNKKDLAVLSDLNEALQNYSTASDENRAESEKIVREKANELYSLFKNGNERAVAAVL